MEKMSYKEIYEFDKINWREFSPSPVIGVDEVGRGCLAGPVYAGAVILKSEIYEEELTDSKLLTESKRLRLAGLIQQHHIVSIGIASEKEIEELNILQASFLAMKRAIQGLKIETGHILVDGKFKIPDLACFKQTPIIKGDLRAAPISAASICAKVARDQFMGDMAKKYPGYGLQKHKGYATVEHREAIKRLGPCALHRVTFGGVREYLKSNESNLNEPNLNEM